MLGAISIIDMGCKEDLSEEMRLLFVLKLLSLSMLHLSQKRSQGEGAVGSGLNKLLADGLNQAELHIAKLSHGTYHAEFIGPATIFLSLLTLAAGLATAPVVAVAVAAGTGVVVSAYGMWTRSNSMKSMATRVYDAANKEAKALEPPRNSTPIQL